MKILLLGACGKMGVCVQETLAPPHEIVCGVDLTPRALPFPVYPAIADVKERADVAIDFSSPQGLDERLAYCAKKNMPLVLACTGFSAKNEEKIKYYARHITIFKSENFSFGVALLAFFAKMTAETFPAADAEIIEKHHNLKKDAPSGTALMLARAINAGFNGRKRLVLGRSGADALRSRDEIGLHAVRAGTIAGEHEVLFACEDETIALSHSAQNRKVFARGALKAAEWCLNRPAGLYGMDDLWEG